MGDDAILWAIRQQENAVKNYAAGMGKTLQNKETIVQKMSKNVSNSGGS
jgi:hypothetical protein